MKKVLSTLLLITLITQIANALEVTTTVPNTLEPKGLIIIAPAKKYLMHERLFEQLTNQLTEKKYVVVRFDWSSDTFTVPSLEKEKASQDLNYIVSRAQALFNMPPSKTILISKSFSTKIISDHLERAKLHILLTPNCSTKEPFALNYKNTLDRAKNWKIVISLEDPYCQVDQIIQEISSRQRLDDLFLTHGNHNFETIVENEIIHPFQDLVIKKILSWVD